MSSSRSACARSSRAFQELRRRRRDRVQDLGRLLRTLLVEQDAADHELGVAQARRHVGGGATEQEGLRRRLLVEQRLGDAHQRVRHRGRGVADRDEPRTFLQVLAQRHEPRVLGVRGQRVVRHLLGAGPVAGVQLGLGQGLGHPQRCPGGAGREVGEERQRLGRPAGEVEHQRPVVAAQHVEALVGALGAEAGQRRVAVAGAEQRPGVEDRHDEPDGPVVARLLKEVVGRRPLAGAGAVGREQEQRLVGVGVGLDQRLRGRHRPVVLAVGQPEQEHLAPQLEIPGVGRERAVEAVGGGAIVTRTQREPADEVVASGAAAVHGWPAARARGQVRLERAREQVRRSRLLLRAGAERQGQRGAEKGRGEDPGAPARRGRRGGMHRDHP